MSTPPQQPTNTSKTTDKPNNKRRREHPLFIANDAVKSARQLAATARTGTNQPAESVSTSGALAISTALPSKGTYAASRPDTITANGAATFSTSGSPTVDLFFNGLVRGCEKQKLNQLLAASWQSNPRVTLQLIAHSRDCRSGKGERLVSLHSLLYLRTHKRLTYIANLLLYLRCGYFKDLLQLARMVEEAGGERLGERELLELEVMAEFIRYDAAQLDKEDKRKAGRDGKEEAEDERDEKEEKDGKDGADEEDKEEDEYVLVEEIGKLSAADSQDGKADTDKKDGKAAKDEKDKKSTEEQKAKKSTAKRRVPRARISLAGKWAATEGSAFDQAPSRFAHRLARLLFPDAPRPLPLYRKLLGRLRAHLQVVEKLMCAQQWDGIQFDRVPSKAHKLLKGAFQRHQSERYREYLAAVRRGDKKVKVAGLQPHDLTKAYRQGGPQDETTELQWAALIERTKASSGKLMGAVAVVDVSGSMECGRGSVQPIDPAIALGLLIANVATGPFNRRVLTFHSQPDWFVLPNDSLHAQVAALKVAPWGGNTDFQKTMDLILTLAVRYDIPASEMPSTLFILSDMQFDVACGPFNVTNYEVLRTKYSLAGYAMPGVVLWNLNGGHGSDAPVRSNKAGVAMLSGYSGELLRLIMDGEGATMTPESIMLTAVEKYDVVVEEAEK